MHKEVIKELAKRIEEEDKRKRFGKNEWNPNIVSLYCLLLLYDMKLIAFSLLRFWNF